jgi:phospholipid/cholesterol/gamma-HCH transport system permease protein
VSANEPRVDIRFEAGGLPPLEEMEVEARGRLGPLALIGDFVSFLGSSARDMSHMRHFTAEAVRQAAIVAAGSVLVIMAIAFLAGGSCGLESTSLARSFGVDPVAGGFSSWCTLREVVPFVFGYIVAAKVGCGIVAELGAMRIHEEIDALDAMGVRSVAYLVNTRMLGCAVVLPIAYLLAVGSAYLAAWLVSLKRFGDVSPGTWDLFFYNFQDPLDLVYSVVKGLLIAAFVVSVAAYYGYRVRGGPVEVGGAVARSMAVNIIGVTVISMIGTLIFWGANPRIPIG